MSCPEALTRALYADDGLAPDARRAFEAHLIGCERCRRAVVALREEARLLTDVLQERAPDGLPLRDEAPARGFLMGMPLTLFAAGAVVAVGGAILEMRLLPSGAAWLSPARLIGVPEMFFDVVFALRDRAPGLLELAVAVAATAAFAMLVTAAAGVLLRRVGGGRAALGLGLAALGAGVALATVAPAPARAELRTHFDESVHVAEGEVWEGALVASGESVRIDGTLDGTLVVFTERLDVRGRVRGDVFGLVRKVEISGAVEGSLHVVAEELRLDGSVSGSVWSAAERIDLDSDARIARDLGFVAEEIQLAGEVGRDVHGLADRVEAAGRLGRDVEVWAAHVTVDAPARIGGDLRAHVPEEERLELLPGAQVAGETHALVSKHVDRSHLAHYGEPGFYLWLLVRAAGAFAVGLLLYWLLPQLFQGRLPTGSDFLSCLVRGAAWLVLTPLALALLALTLVGLPLAMLGGAVFLAALYAASLLVAALVGASLLQPGSATLRDFTPALAVGIVVLVIGMHLPFVGVLVRVVVLLVGLGLLVERLRRLLRARTRGAAF